MTAYNKDLARAEHEPLSDLDEGERNFLETIESMAQTESPSISRNVGVSNAGFDSKNGLSNTSGQEKFVQKSLRETATDTSNEFRLCRKDSEEEFTNWPKRRIKLQGGSLAGDKERINEAVDIITDLRGYPEICTAVSDEKQPLESNHKWVIEDKKMECTSSEPCYNLPGELSSKHCESLLGEDAIASTTVTELTAITPVLASNTEVYAGLSKHILDLPDLVLEHILGFVDLNDISQKVRPVCRTFYNISSRILRLEFKNIQTRLSSTLQKLENQHPGRWNPICAEVLTCKLLQSEMETLRAACSRQVESGDYCFIHGDVLHEYHNILHAIQDGKINGMLDGFSDTLIKLNEKPLKYWDNRYDDEDMSLEELKLLGVEIIEVLLSALNASGCVVVTYQPSFTFASSSEEKQGEDVSGSCMMAGCVNISHSTELKAPPTEHISVKAQRRTILKYIRSLVRANNCDIVLYKLRAYSKEKDIGAAPLPVFEHRTWALCHSKAVHHDMVQESYRREPVTDYLSTPIPDCNMQLVCSFEMVCPKRANPFGIPLDRLHQSPLPSEILINEEKETPGSSLAETLSGDHYIFKMDFKTYTPGNSDEHSIEIENFVTKTNKWLLNINTNSS